MVLQESSAKEQVCKSNVNTKQKKSCAKSVSVVTKSCAYDLTDTESLTVAPTAAGNDRRGQQ